MELKFLGNLKCRVWFCALAITLLAGCDLQGDNSSQVALPNSGGVGIPDVMLSPQAAELFANGGQVVGVLNIYTDNGATPSQVVPSSNTISDTNTSEVTWNVDLSGDLSRYTFEVEWKWRSQNFKALDNVSDILFARSATKEHLGSNNTLYVSAYDYVFYNINVFDRIVSGGDPLACVLGASMIGHCRLG